MKNDDNLRGEPSGDWADKGIRPTTDRVPQVLLLIDRVENLTRRLTIAERALRTLANNGNDYAKSILEQMK